MAFCLLEFLFGFVLPQGGQRLARQRVEGQHIEYGHQADAHVAEVPHHGVGLHPADDQHHQRQHLVGRLPEPAVTEEIGHVAAGVVEDADKSREAEQCQRHCDEDDAETAQMVLHRRLQKVHALQAARHALGSQQHHEGRAAADDDGVDEDAQRLHEAHLHGVIALSGSSGAGGRTGTSLVGEKAPLDAVHHHSAEAAAHSLTQAQRLRENAGEDTGQLGQMGEDDPEGHDKVAARHDRDDDVEALDGGLLPQDDDRRKRRQHQRRDQRRDGERILERLAHRVADHLTDAAPADEARHGEQAGYHRAAELSAPFALREGVEIVGRAAPPAAVKGVGLLVFLGQRRLHKGGGCAQQSRHPHPEHRACTAHRHRRHDAHQIAHAHPGGRGHHQRLEGREAAALVALLADRRQHIPEQPHRQKPRAQGEEHPRRQQ